MADKNSNKTEENFASVEQVLGKSEQFIEKNKKMISYITLGVIGIILLGVLYNNYVIKPNKLEAYDQVFMAQKYFEMDSLNQALNGDGINPGFLKIIEDYGSTPTGNLANFYAGICYLKLGGLDATPKAKENFEKAIEYLEDFESDDMLVAPTAKARIGDAYMELGQMDKAVDAYLEAARMDENEFSTPVYLMRAGQTYSILNKHKEALELYKEIEAKYYRSSEAREIKKYIGYEEQLLGL